MLSAILSPASLNIRSQLDPLLSLSNMAVAACEWIDGYLKWKTSNCSQLAVGFKVVILLSLLQPFARSLFVFDSGRETGPFYPREMFVYLFESKTSEICLSWTCHGGPRKLPKLQESFGMIPFPGCQWKVKVTGMLGPVCLPKKGFESKTPQNIEYFCVCRAWMMLSYK